MFKSLFNLSILQLIIIALSPVCVWLAFAFYKYIKTKKFKLWGFKFTVLNYLIFMSAIAIPFILYLIFTQNYPVLIFILLAGIMGMLGEYWFSLWWRQFFWKGFWDYKHAAILRGDTSLLNGPAWSLGGLLILAIFKMFTYVTNMNLIDLSNIQTVSNYFANFVLYTLLGIAFSIILSKLILKKDFRGKTFLRYLLFASGIFLFIGLFSNKYGLIWLLLFVIWGLVCFILEYLYGKVLVKFVGKKLWLYMYLTIDNYHTSLLNILPFALGGFYFFNVYLLTLLILHYI
jgi:hypothetical protein